MNKGMRAMCSDYNKVINNNSFMKCSNKRCEKLYEIKRLAISQEQFDKFTQEYKDAWVCPDCVFAHFMGVNRNITFGLPRHKNYSLTSPDNHGQARIDQKGEEKGKLPSEFTAFRSEIMLRFNRIESQSASLHNILIDKAGQSDLHTRITNLEEKLKCFDNNVTDHMNQLTSDLELLERFMRTIQRQLMEIDLKLLLLTNVSSVSGSRSNEHTRPRPFREE